MGHFGSKVFVAELALWDEPNVGLKCQYPGPVNVSAITNKTRILSSVTIKKFY